MYAIGNVEKFLLENPGIADPERSAILARARAMATPKGVLMAGQSEEIWGSAELSDRFTKVLGSDMDHIEIGLKALRPL